MYEEIFNQIRSAANKRNLKDSTIHAYCTSVAHFLQTGYLLLNGNAPISTITILIDNAEMKISVIMKVLCYKKYRS